MKRWTKDEIEILKSKYYVDSWEDICELIPERSLKSIKRKAEQLNLTGRNLNVWDDKEVEIIKKEYPNSSNKHISEKIGRTEFAVQAMAKKIGLIKSNNFHFLRKNNPKLENFNTENKDFCYLLGLMMADGTIDEERNKISLGLKFSDKELLEKICEKFGGYIRPTSKKLDNKIYKGFRWNLNGSDVVKEFKKYGLVQRKTFRTIIPDLPKENFRDFVRGYFDGDGSIFFIDRRKKYRRVVLTGYLYFLNNLKNLLCDFKIFTGQSIKKQSKANCYDLNYNRQNEIKKIKEFMYYDNCLCLERKKTIFNNI